MNASLNFYQKSLSLQYMAINTDTFDWPTCSRTKDCAVLSGTFVPHLLSQGLGILGKRRQKDDRSQRWLIVSQKHHFPETRQMHISAHSLTEKPHRMGRTWYPTTSYVRSCWHLRAGGRKRVSFL